MKKYYIKKEFGFASQHSEHIAILDEDLNVVEQRYFSGKNSFAEAIRMTDGLTELLTDFQTAFKQSCKFFGIAKYANGGSFKVYTIGKSHELHVLKGISDKLIKSKE